MSNRKPLTKANYMYDTVVDVIAVMTATVVIFGTAIHFASGHAIWYTWAIWGFGAIAISLIIAVDTEVKWRRREQTARRVLARIASN